MSTNSAISAVLRRIQEGSLPGQRADGLKIGLLIEGGGMRGVVSAGMVAGMEYLGLRSAFDALYATSAGAINGAYFLAGQAAYGTTIYYEDINNRKFINYRRLLAGRPAWSMDYIFNEVLAREKELDWQAVLRSPIPLKMFASCIDELELVRFDAFHSRDSLFAALRASSSFPILTGEPFVLEGRRLLDGGLIDPVPYRYALDADGCTHLIVMITRPDGDYSPPGSLDTKLAFFLNRYQKGLGKFAVHRLFEYLTTIRDLARFNDEPNSVVYTLKVPRSEPKVARSEIRRDVLVNAAVAGMRVVYRDFFGLDPLCHEVLRPGDSFGRLLMASALTPPST